MPLSSLYYIHHYSQDPILSAAGKVTSSLEYRITSDI